MPVKDDAQAAMDANVNVGRIEAAVAEYQALLADLTELDQLSTDASAGRCLLTVEGSVCGSVEIDSAYAASALQALTSVKTKAAQALGDALAAASKQLEPVSNP